ncbi:GH13863 [Drosophila grimshawi]|uniref:GH13863 n=1 Tax=Drosophila grimshawi TaxID=7222 RepID=B4JP40_DROGR|nr:GH13863 [Drosophila grimshawi]
MTSGDTQRAHRGQTRAANLGERVCSINNDEDGDDDDNEDDDVGGWDGGWVCEYGQEPQMQVKVSIHP